MLFLFNWQRKAADPSPDAELLIAASATGNLKTKHKRRRLSLSKPLRDIDFPMHEADEEDNILLILGVI